MQKLLQDIKNQEYSQIYLLHGEEDYLRKQYRDKLKEALIDDGDTMNNHYYEGKDMKILSNMTNMEKISTNSPLDELLDGGIDKRTITQVYGPPGVGKTNICLSIAIGVAKRGKNPCRIYRLCQ